MRKAGAVDSFQRDGLTFDVRDAGPADGEPVVLLHGFPQDSAAWNQVAPALHRMTEAGLLKAEWHMSDAGRRARFYVLTSKGRRQLEAQEKRWRAISAAVAKVLGTA